MIESVLIRGGTSDHGTFGRLLVEGRFFCFIAEPPWRGNRPQVSCVPPGDYVVEPWHSKRFPQSYHLCDVPERTAILTHSGNLAGDRSKQFITHTLGCLLPGLKLGYIGKQKAVFLSLPAMNAIRERIGRTCFRMHIEGA